MQLNDLEPLRERFNCFVMLLQQCEADVIAYHGSHMTYDESNVFFMKIMYASTKLVGLVVAPSTLASWRVAEHTCTVKLRPLRIADLRSKASALASLNEAVVSTMDKQSLFKILVTKSVDDMKEVGANTKKWLNTVERFVALRQGHPTSPSSSLQ